MTAHIVVKCLAKGSLIQLFTAFLCHFFTSEGVTDVEEGEICSAIVSLREALNSKVHFADGSSDNFYYDH